MDLTTALQTTFNTATIIKLYDNKDYNFSINLIKATKENPYQILFTSGLSIKGQNVPEKHQEFQFIELYFCLPEYWKHDDQSKDNQWPVFWLNKLAEVPSKNNSWFGPGDTIPAGKPPKQLSKDLLQNHFILAEPMLFDSQLTALETDSKSIKFLAIIPIFNDEFTFKSKNSAKVLMAKYQYKKYNELVDKYRKPITNKMSFKFLIMLIITLLIATAVVWVLITGGEIQKENKKSTPPQNQQTEG